jgi:rhamnosyl/mannosyltransferase
LAWAFRRLVADYDVIHYHFPWPFADFMHLFSRINKPCVLTYHSDIVRQKILLPLYRPLMHAFLKRMDAIVATSPNYLASSRVLQAHQANVSVIPIGLDEALYPEVPEVRQAYWQARFNAPFFLFVGVMRYYKGLRYVLEALKETPIPLVVVGHGPLELELKRMASNLGLSQVHFLGEVNEVDKIALFRACLGVVFPSHLRSEAFGVSLLEGAMHGKPLISCEIGTGTSYINVQGVTGYVVAPQNPPALCEAMMSLFNNTALSQSMGREARARFTALFTGSKMVQAYENVYRRVVTHKQKQ